MRTIRLVWVEQAREVGFQQSGFASVPAGIVGEEATSESRACG